MFDSLVAPSMTGLATRIGKSGLDPLRELSERVVSELLKLGVDGFELFRGDLAACDAGK